VLFGEEMKRIRDWLLGGGGGVGSFFSSLSSFRKWLYFYNIGLSSRTVCA